MKTVEVSADGKSPKVREFVLFVDTNAIWTKDEDVQLLPGEFKRRWERLSAPGDVKLVIPDVVLIELAWQKQHHLLRAYQNARAALAKVESELGLGTPQIPEIEWGRTGHIVLWKLRDQIKTTPHCESVAIPYEEIGSRIRGIVDASLWRLPPFKTGKVEAGFRDALILETVRKFHTGLLHCDIGFISRDERLREAAEKEFVGAKSFSLFADLEEYESFLELARSKFAPEFLHAVKNKAHSVFLDRVWPDLKIENLLRDRLDLQGRKVQFDNRDAKPGPLQRLLIDSMEVVGEVSFDIVSTGLLSVVGADEFHWGTRIVVSTPHKRFTGAPRGVTGGLIAGAMGAYRSLYRVLLVSLEWSCTVTDTQGFSDLRVLRDVVNVETFVDTDDELRELKGDLLHMFG